MGGVRTFSQHSQNENLYSLKQRPGGFGNVAAVGHIRQTAESEPRDGKLTVQDGKRLQFDGPGSKTIGYPVNLDLKDPASLLNRTVEEMTVDDAKRLLHLFRGVEVDRQTGDELNRPQLIEAEEVIDMGVGVNDISDKRSSRTKELVAKIDAGIDEQMTPLRLPDSSRLKKGRGSGPLVSRVRRGAGGTPAADHGDSA